MIQDQDLIAKCIKHDLKAQRELYNRYAPKLMPMALRYAKSHQDGEDILQESFIKIFKNLKSFRGDAQFLTWMKRIVINTAINHNRGKLKKESMLAIEDVTLYVEKDMILSDFHFTELLAMIQRLPTGCRTIFNLFALEGFGHREIAEQLGISEGTSKSQYARARALLMSMVEKANRVLNSNISG